ncbi:gag pol polyprotein [Penaeus vannamei]|uniref:RNA-directed DNA polymerase n=1 Tax=Penaeus vannamei TaxID=6689 RepID=A0A423U995_PENVA|nr:gag pol polyprotein [Penaeus vannamei]
MDGILGDLPFCAYVDDILIFSRDPNEHLQHLRVALKRLHNNGLVVRQDKCQFGATSVEFLGTRFRQQASHPFQIAHIMEPLYNSLAGKPKKLEWGLSNKSVRDHQDCPCISYNSHLPHTRHSTYPYHRRKLHCYHQPLVHAFSKPGDAWSDRQQRQLSSIAEFGCSIKYTPGTITSLQWKDVHIGGEGRTILCDVSTGRPRPLIPKSFRRKIFNLIHGLSHPSGRTTARLMKDKFIWHGMNKDIKQWARCCVACQMSKENFGSPCAGLDISVDVVGPLPPSDGAQYLFTATERSTRWPEAIPMQHTTTARDCAEALLHGWISRFGVPDDITSDPGPAFTSQLWTSLGELMGSTIHHTTSYNPEANDSEHLTKLRHAVEKYRPCTQTHSTSPQYLPKLIHSCKYVFVRNDAHRSPLTRPYRGPYAVLERNPKAYRLSIGGKSDWVSIDRLKPAYLEEKEPTPTTPLADNPAHTVPPSNAPAHVSHPEDKPFQISSRSGRLIRQPNRLDL